VDFAFSVGSVFSDPASHVSSKKLKFSSGYEFFDLITGGGFSPKTLVTFVGQAKIGKSLILGNLATKAVMAGSNVAVVTLEMSEQMYTKRMGSNLLNVDIKKYDDYVTSDPVGLKSKLNDMGITTFTMPGQLVVKEFPTSTLSVPDLEIYLKRAEETLGIKFRLVVLDYINIMKNWRNEHTENTYMKIKQIAEDLRAIAIRNEWTILTATQAKQSFFDSTDMNMGAASESSGLVATVDLMMGIIQTPEMYGAGHYIFKCLANRGEGYKNVKKQFTVDYRYMRVEEDMTVAMSEDVI
jgi:KaiC/GvpD/RAD55 family RecA-like ATPase